MIPMFEPVAVMTAIAEHGITDVLLVPTMIQLLVDHPRIDEFDLTGLRRIIYGASPMSEGVLNRAVKALPNATFTQAYGMTELSPCATLLLPADHEHPVHRRSAGRAVLHGEVRIVGPDDVEVPRGTVGEICAAPRRRQDRRCAPHRGAAAGGAAAHACGRRAAAAWRKGRAASCRRPA